MSQQYATNSYVVEPNDYEPPECPPEAEFILMLIGIKEIGLGKPFKEGDDPKVQFVLEFKIDAEQPAPGTLQEEWHHFDLIGWYTPLLHYEPDLPGFDGRRYKEPNLYKLARALNGGTPVPIPTENDPNTGKIRFAPYDAAALLQPLFLSRFRSVVGPSASGWPRLKGDPMPLLQPGGGRRRGAARAAATATMSNGNGNANAAAEAPADTSDDFEGEEDL